VKLLFRTRGVDVRYEPCAAGDRPGPQGRDLRHARRRGQIDYDFINVIPPQRAPQVVRDSGLSWADRWTDQGWIEVDKHTLRHLRYPNVFGIGDINGVPKGKTAASVKWHLPVVEDHLIAEIAGPRGHRDYNGYTSCPLITRIGRAMLIEFDYDDNLVPLLPRHHRAAGGAVDFLADEGGGAEGHLQRHAARPA
jgi:sulfide:quinone oxidoreductase